MFRRKPPVDFDPSWLIVGLGNPGAQYRGTRHNVGFEVIDQLAKRWHIKVDRSRHHALMGIGKVNETSAVLCKPLTFMNLSGQAVAPLARQFGIKPDQILVIADDLDLPVGKIRLRDGGGAGGHNGHRSLIQSLGTQEYPRIKIGVEKVDKSATIDHVLGPFEHAERQIIDVAIRSTLDVIETFVNQGQEFALRIVEHHNKGL
jgi:PTH1 family peptidyl-tRNA hydrolase